jgi:A/G-specific adenine glycosylase
MFGMTERQIQQFITTVWHYYQAHGRHDLPWRQPEPDGSFDPYKILVSELMLQQTQVARVLGKYPQFLAQFPSVQALASAPLGSVLVAWQGLGYNRRAKYLWQAAQKIASDYGGALPKTSKELAALPGVGANTAGALLAYAFDQPSVFVETNIRTVFIYHFFQGQSSISDSDILALVQKTLPQANYRNWYWALMDYGAYLKQKVGNNISASRSYHRQSPLRGSRREIRGQVLRLLAASPHSTSELQHAIIDERLPSVLADMQAEELIITRQNRYSLFE